MTRSTHALTATTAPAGGPLDTGLGLVFLGTAGGPLPQVRAGVSTVVEVDGATYVVDAGAGAVRNFGLARLRFRDLRAMFLTHLHSDHTADWFNFFLLNWNAWGERVIDVHGPGPVPATDAAGGRDGVPAIPGIVAALEHQVRANAADLALRVRGEATRPFPALTGQLAVHELPLPERASERDRWPTMDPVLVHEDDRVRVTSTLVRHGEVVPAYAFRFETERGSVVFSGDSAPCANLDQLAQGADVLVCEVLALDESLAWIRQRTDASALQHHFVRGHVLLDAQTTDPDEPPQPGIGAMAQAMGVGTLVLTHLVPADDSLAPEEFAARAQVGFSGQVLVAEDLHRLRLA